MFNLSGLIFGGIILRGFSTFWLFPWNIVVSKYYKITHLQNLIPAKYLYSCHSRNLIRVKNHAKYLKNGWMAKSRQHKY